MDYEDDTGSEYHESGSESAASDEVDESASSSAGGAATNDLTEPELPGAPRTPKVTKEKTTGAIASYIQLLNESITEIAQGYTADSSQPLRPSTIGVTRWSADEKDIFFSAVESFGRDAIDRIAHLLGTKSETEVRTYATLLQQGLDEFQRHHRDRHPLGIADIPFAFELSDECCNQLAQIGDTVERSDQSLRIKREQAKHGDHWLLDWRVADAIERCFDHSGRPRKDQGNCDVRKQPFESDSEVEEAESDIDSPELKAIPSAKLLRLRQFLQLSSQIFMVRDDSLGTENWWDICGPNEGPAIYHTAFSDLHTLVVSVTRRLVSTTIFAASSRLRASKTKGKALKAIIRHDDVEAAIETLGMPKDSRDFWEKIEDRISEKETSKQATNTEHSGPSPPPETQNNEPDEDSSFDPSSGSEISEIDAFSNEQESDEVIYAEKFDQFGSQAEGQRLRTMLGLAHPDAKAKENDAELPPSPGERLKRYFDEDWRDSTDRVAEWESFRELSARNKRQKSEGGRPGDILKRIAFSPT